jgi:DNA-binding protein HU-beta
MSNKKTVVDGYQWSYDRYIKDDPELVEFSKDIREKAALAQQIYDIREKLRMTREDLAEFSGLSAETIEDLEESDYDGDWDEAIQKVNTGFHSWFTNVILPVARMKPEELSVGIAG